jgi:lipoprotein LprG
MLMRRLIAGAFALTVLTATGCTPGDDELPDAATLLDEAATSTREITSAHISLNATGRVPGLSVQSLDGALTREGGEGGAAQGTGTMSLGGQVVEVEFVLAEETLYLKGPTGGYQRLPAAIGASVYDPSAVLDPERGISKIISSVREPETETTEDVDGTGTYKVNGTVGGEVLADLLPGVRADADISVWLSEEEGHLPVKAALLFPAADGEDGERPSVEVTLSDIDEPVTVSPPT